MYVVLFGGALTMLYPFLLMLSGSIASNHSEHEFRLLPRYLYSERGLFETHLFNKYYRYEGVGDIERQWKVTVPASTAAGRSGWTQVPGQSPFTDDQPGWDAVYTALCIEPYNRFALLWRDKAPADAIRQCYPFAANELEHVVALDRNRILQLVKQALAKEMQSFEQRYRAAGEPSTRSLRYQEILEHYPALAGSNVFASTMTEYEICRKPDLSNTTVHQRLADYGKFRGSRLPLALRDSYWVGGRSRSFDGDEQWREFLHSKYHNLANLNHEHGTKAASWAEVYAPSDRLDNRNVYVPDTPEQRDWYQFKKQLPEKYVRPAASEYWWSEFLSQRYGGSIAKLNEAYQTNYVRFFDVGLPELQPRAEPAAGDWAEYVRTRLSARFMRFVGGDELWRRFLLSRLGSLEQINAQLKRSYGLLEQVRLPDLQRDAVGNPPTKQENDLLLEFILSGNLPLQHVRVATAENLYRHDLLEKYGSLQGINDAHGLLATSIDQVYFPMAEVDWREMTEQPWSIRRYTLTRSYRTAISHIFYQKRSLWNTAVLCAFAVGGALIVNPLSAYALSRFNLPAAYQILLFLLATMAFPAEVTIIPNFLLIKSFPLFRIVCGIIGAGVGVGLALIFLSRKPVLLWLAAMVGGALGATVVSNSFIYVAHLTNDGSVSLLNTYWALVLPSIASGYSIFILKGFFDSLPAELYESATIDGAGEVRTFLTITLPLSKPVLAIIALWTFTAAYGSFIWALVVCQDEKMWTLMVHLYQYQMNADASEQLAAFALATIPTLSVFIIAQRTILRGIVLPSYK